MESYPADSKGCAPRSKAQSLVLCDLCVFVVNASIQIPDKVSMILRLSTVDEKAL